MRFIKMTETATAQIQCCGVWIQVWGTIIGIFPESWWRNRNDKYGTRSPEPFVFGMKIWAADHHSGVHNAFQIETAHLRFGYARAFSEPGEGRTVGWYFRRLVRRKVLV